MSGPHRGDDDATRDRWLAVTVLRSPDGVVHDGTLPPGPEYAYDQIKQQLRLQSGRPTALREAIFACRKGGSVFCLGVFAGVVDKFPLGAMMNKGLVFRGAQQHGQRYIPALLDRIAGGDLPTRHLATHPMTLDEGPRGYEMFKQKQDGCVRPVFQF
jgi:Zn-dependent alcohol dehydrogenase